jgi:hypothetical protein
MEVRTVGECEPRRRRLGSWMARKGHTHTHTPHRRWADTECGQGPKGMLSHPSRWTGRERGSGVSLVCQTTRVRVYCDESTTIVRRAAPRHPFSHLHKHPTQVLRRTHTFTHTSKWRQSGQCATTAPTKALGWAQQDTQSDTDKDNSCNAAATRRRSKGLTTDLCEGDGEGRAPFKRLCSPVKHTKMKSGIINRRVELPKLENLSISCVNIRPLMMRSERGRHTRWVTTISRWWASLGDTHRRLVACRRPPLHPSPVLLRAVL